MIPADEFLDHPVDEQWFPVFPFDDQSSTPKHPKTSLPFIPSNHGTAVLMKICFNSKEVFSRAWRCRDGFLNWGSTVWRTSEKNVRSFFMGQKHHGNHAGRGKFLLITPKQQNYRNSHCAHDNVSRNQCILVHKF